MTSEEEFNKSQRELNSIIDDIKDNERLALENEILEFVAQRKQRDKLLQEIFLEYGLEESQIQQLKKYGYFNAKSEIPELNDKGEIEKEKIIDPISGLPLRNDEGDILYKIKILKTPFRTEKGKQIPFATMRIITLSDLLKFEKEKKNIRRRGAIKRKTTGKSTAGSSLLVQEVKKNQNMEVKQKQKRMNLLMNLNTKKQKFH